MKVTFLISSTYGGGAERVTCNLANYLKNKGYTIEILCMRKTEKSYFLEKEIKVSPIIKDYRKKNSIFDYLIFFHKIRKYMIRHDDVDVYIVMLPIITVIMMILRKYTNAKVIASERGNPSSYSKIRQVLLKYYAKQADVFVFQTVDAKLWYGKSVEKCQSIVIPNAVNPEFICPYYEGKKIKRIISAGRLVKQKNFSILIKAFSKICHDFSDYKLTIFGEGPEKENLINLSRKYDVHEKVEFLGQTDLLSEELEKSTIYVLSSDYEGMPNILIEAMAVGLPCIATDCPCGGPKFLIKDRVNGILIPVGDADRLEESIRELLSNSSYREKLGFEAKKICERLNPEKIYAIWEELLF